ncbi:MAG: chemotaxis protein CheB [Merismopediaceae bacterium]|nr:chemotaxis protein CheB [Merismopediaceae bacterium]
MKNNLLCIGASTYNPNTPSKINDALVESNFLKNGSVILAIHQYFPLYRPARLDPQESFSVDEQKNWIKESCFPDCNLIFIEEPKKYEVEPGHIFISPDTFPYKNGDKLFDVGLRELESKLFIHGQNRISKLDEFYGKYMDMNHFNYLPCINQIMTQLSQTRVYKNLGMILAGMEDDGSIGLVNIAKNKGKIAIQDPDECYHPERPGKTRQMPESAVKQLQKESLDYELITLESNENSKKKKLDSVADRLLGCFGL